MRLEKAAQDDSADPKYYKALELATKEPVKAASIVRQLSQ